MRLVVVPLNGEVYVGSGTALIAAPVGGAVPMTRATLTPKSRGRVCAVTSYGRLGGPPGYSNRLG